MGRPSCNERQRQRACRLALVAAGARLARAGLILPGEGNLSARYGADTVMVTPSGADKGCLRACDLICCAVDQAPPPEASSESALHLGIYRASPAVAAIVHAHPPAVVRLSARGRVPDVHLLAEAEVLLGRIGSVACLPPGSQELADGVVEAARSACASVLHRHGAVTVAGDVTTALRRMLVLELLARTMERAPSQ